ncbi:MAG: M14 family metallopeptidase [Bacteroidia bacterium]
MRAILSLILVAFCLAPTKPNLQFPISNLQSPIADTWLTPYERSGKVATSTWADAISYYTRLARENKQVKIDEIGLADVGRPIHLVTISNSEVTDAADARKQGKRVLFINNAIHPGEPCGVDASMMLARDILYKPGMQRLLDHTVICIIPLYNVGGSLNRGCCSRANQQGPQAYGFRGNARNLDLNRDFVKCDSRNALAFSKVFQKWLPDFFIDTHTTNGADYPAHITFIPSMSQKLPPMLASLMSDKVMPTITETLNKQGIPSSVYVNPLRWGNPPEQGLSAFADHPRYATGYASLFGCLSLVTEAHMLKTFEQRVSATYATLESGLTYLHNHHKAVGETIQKARQHILMQQTETLFWELDRSQHDSIMYHGYAPKYKESTVTGSQQLYYDRTAPFSQNIPYYQTYTAKTQQKTPQAYIVPHAYRHVIERLKANGVEMRQFSDDEEVEVEVSYIVSFKSRTTPWEGHFYHDEVITRTESETLAFHTGDYLVPTDQAARAYIMHVLEPESHDSFFRWNFFDGILMQKEWFSAYVFEPEAEQMLQNDDQLQLEFEQKLASDSAFAASPFMRLYYLYKKSPNFEPTYMRYPVGRVN